MKNIFIPLAVLLIFFSCKPAKVDMNYLGHQEMNSFMESPSVATPTQPSWSAGGLTAGGRVLR